MVSESALALVRAKYYLPFRKFLFVKMSKKALALNAANKDCRICGLELA